MKKFLAIAFFSFISFFCVCSEDSKNTNFVLQLENKFPNLHPYLVYESSDMQITTATNEGLFTYDPYSSLPVKALAKNYTVTGNTWRFEIRENARFENGDEITAETIKQSWLNLLSPEVDFPYASLLDCVQGAKEYRTGKTQDNKKVAITVESKYVLLLYLNEPTPHLSSILCNIAFAVVHPSQFEYAYQYQKKPNVISAKNAFIPISSGPYKITNYTDKQIIFEKNKNYWDASSVGIEKITLRLDLSEDEQAESFNRGELQWSKNATFSELVGSQIISYAPLFATSFLFFNVADQNVADKKVRRALLLATPYESLRKQFYLPAETLVFPLAGYPEVKGINEQNKDQAKKLFESLKLSDKSKAITIKVFDYQFHKAIAEELKVAWQEIGFIVNIQTILPNEDLKASLNKNNYSITLLSWIADFADPLAMLELFRSDSTLNASNWKDKNFDAIILAANNESNGLKRYKKLAEAETYLLESCMLIPLGFRMSVNIIDISEIEGWYPNALDIHPFKFIDYKKKQLAPGFI